MVKNKSYQEQEKMIRLQRSKAEPILNPPKLSSLRKYLIFDHQWKKTAFFIVYPVMLIEITTYYIVFLISLIFPFTVAILLR